MRMNNRQGISTVCLALALSAAGCADNASTGGGTSVRDGDRVGCFGVVHEGRQAVDTGVLIEREKERKAAAERMDREGLLFSGRVVVDRDESMLAVPPSVREHFNGGTFTVGETPPDIEFAIVPVTPKFLARYNNQDESGWWGNYCQSNYHAPTSTFYSGVADHGTYDAHMYLVAYETESMTIRCLPEVNASLGRSRDDFGDGILHGWLDIYRSGHLERPHLWFCTYWARFPEPAPEDYATGYDGGHIVSCDFTTGEYVDYGAPLPRTSWPYHRVDTRRGMLYAVSLRSEFLAWDIEKQRTRWAGFLPDGMTWYNRTILLDEETGRVYSINAHESDEDAHMLMYDPSTNRFTVLDCSMPVNTATGTVDPMRAQTRHRGPDGLFYGVTSSGELFTFDPERETVEAKGLDWPGDRRYCCSLERSPGGRYIYFQVNAYNQGSPVIQYDTETGVRKVIAFAMPYYYDKYGYIPTFSYSLKLNDTGDKLFVMWNGAFKEFEEDLGVTMWGHCAVMIINIPESERIE